MNSFCEECGNKLGSDERFCQECGTPIEVDAANLDESKTTGNPVFDFFVRPSSDLAKLVQDYACGIWLTNFAQLERTLGQAETERLKGVVAQYIEQLKHVGVYYLVLDVSANSIKKPSFTDWKAHISLLTKAIKLVKRKLKSDVHFALLFGGNEIIPMPRLPNPYYNPDDLPEDRFSDEDVDTDMPYSALSVDCPQRKKAAREVKLPVGRIPTGSETSVNDIVNLFNNTLEAFSELPTHRTFALSAYDWRGPSGYVNGHIGKDELKLSPALTLDTIHEHYPNDIGVHYFNLHGSDSHPYWIGDDGRRNGDPVFGPEIISQATTNNIIGVEACYGAYFIGLPTEKSMVLTALASKTVSFVGSSRIAIGPTGPNPYVNLADIAIMSFLSYVLEGYPAGEAMRLARESAFEMSMQNGSDFKTALLTMVEFNLFGDPVFSIFSQSDKGFSKRKLKLKKAFDADLIEEISESEISESDRKPKDPLSPLSAVQRAVDQAQQRITERINQEIWNTYPAFKGIKPVAVHYKHDGRSYYNLRYNNKQASFGNYLFVNHDAQGKIIATFASK